MRVHPLQNVKQELQAHGHCEELRLELLVQEAIGEYLTRRCPGSTFSNGLAQEVYEHTVSCSLTHGDGRERQYKESGMRKGGPITRNGRSVLRRARKLVSGTETQERRCDGEASA